MTKPWCVEDYAENIARLACAVLSLTPLLFSATQFAQWHTLVSKFKLADRTSNGYDCPLLFKNAPYVTVTRIVRPEVPWEGETTVPAPHVVVQHNAKLALI